MLTTSESVPVEDGTNAFTKVMLGLNGNIGATVFYLSKQDGTVTETDVVLNSSYLFSYGAASSKYDTQSIITHEMGHVLRIKHSSNTSDTMYDHPSTNDISWRTLTNADKEAASDSVNRW